MADKVREYKQYVHLKSKYVGIGNADTTREEFLATIHRDTYASMAHHQSMLQYTAVALGRHPHLLRQDFIKKMLWPSDNWVSLVMNEDDKQL